MQEVKPNPKASFTFYYGEYTIYITSVNCTASLSHYKWQGKFNAFPNLNCRSEKECTWKIRKKNPFVHDASSKQFLKQEYDIKQLI